MMVVPQYFKRIFDEYVQNVGSTTIKKETYAKLVTIPAGESRTIEGDESLVIQGDYTIEGSVTLDGAAGLHDGQLRGAGELKGSGEIDFI